MISIERSRSSAGSSNTNSGRTNSQQDFSQIVILLSSIPYPKSLISKCTLHYNQSCISQPSSCPHFSCSLPFLRSLTQSPTETINGTATTAIHHVMAASPTTPLLQSCPSLRVFFIKPDTNIAKKYLADDFQEISDSINSATPNGPKTVRNTPYFPFSIFILPLLVVSHQSFYRLLTSSSSLAQ